MKINSKIVTSAIAIIGLVVHEYPNDIKLDEISIILICVGILPWVSEWLSSIKMGGFEAKFRKLEDKVEQQEVELDNLKARYSALEEEYLETCSEFRVTSESSDLDKLASKLKAKAKGLSSIDFLFTNLSVNSPQGKLLGAACAIHVRPQFHLLPSLVSLVEQLGSTNELKPLRLKVVFRLIMAIDSIVNLDNKNEASLIEPEYQEKLKAALKKMSTHPYFINDDVSKKCMSVASKL